MMNFVRLASLAAVMLQMGSFVQANPLFEGTHNNDATAAACSDFRVIYPAETETGLTFEDDSRQLIAWKAPASIQYVNVTIADANQKTIAMVNVFDASKQVSGEIPISLNGQDTGEFHYHLAGIGGPACQADSITFTITRAGDDDDDDDDDKKTEKEEHKNADNKDWDDALGKIGHYVQKDNNNNDDKKKKNEHSNNTKTDDDDDKHSNDKWFTNDDKRTHINAHLNAELDTLFSTHDNVGEWQAEELAVDAEPAHEDSADSMFDHTNGATWSEEELDPTHTDVEGFQAEEHDDDATVQFITDYSNVGEWQEEQVDDDNENDATHQDGAWVEDIKTFDHSNVGSWEEVQVADDHDSHNNVVEWQAEVIDTEPAATNDWHENVASSDWVEHDGQDVSHDDQSAWIAEEVDENGWSEAHTNQGPAAAPESDLEWHVDEVHSNGGEWLDESGHANDVPDHTDAAPFIEAEIEALVSDDENSPHSDSSEGWYAEPAHSNDASVGKVGTGRMPSLDQSTHDNDGTIPVMPAEALIAKW